MGRWPEKMAEPIFFLFILCLCPRISSTHKPQVDNVAWPPGSSLKDPPLVLPSPVSCEQLTGGPSLRNTTCSCKLGRVALLLVGASDPEYVYEHTSSMLSAILNPLDGYVFAVADFDGPQIFRGKKLREILPSLLCGRLVAFGLLSSNVKRDSASKLVAGNTTFSVLPFPKSLDPNEKKYGLMQWYRLREAWKLMETHELRTQEYSIVIKLRFDCTPLPTWDICAFSDATSPTSTFRAIHACTDHAFWGRRDYMRVAAQVFDKAMFDYFAKTRPQSLLREFFVAATLQTMLSAPRALWGKSVHYVTHAPSLVNPGQLNNKGVSEKIHPWHHYSKAGSLSWIRLKGDGRQPAASSSYQNAVESMRLALESGIQFVDPLDPGFKKGPWEVVKGPIQGLRDQKRGVFVTESHFVVWMVLHNITVCDMGAGTSYALYKGALHPRPSLPCRPVGQRKVSSEFSRT